MATHKRTSKADKSAAAAAAYWTTFNLHGFDIGMSALTPKLSARDFKDLLGTHAVTPALGGPKLTVLLIDEAQDFEEGGTWHMPELLLGEGFALNYQTHTLYYPRHAPRSLNMKNLGAQNPFTRTVVFSIALLAEFNGPKSVVSKASKFQAPLYSARLFSLDVEGRACFLRRMYVRKDNDIDKAAQRFSVA